MNTTRTIHATSSLPLISIIIPVHNSERYLEQCLQTVLRQTFPELEVIVVDDGSTDRSGTIANDFSASDSRIRVIRQENQGPSAARNAAIREAKADIIGFVDADDWVREDMFEKLYDAMLQNDADVSVCNFIVAFQDQRCGFDLKAAAGNHTHDEIMLHVLSGHLGKSLWNKLFRRRLLQQPLPVGKVYEDVDTLYKWLSHAQRMTIVDEPLYYYRQRKGGITNSRDTAPKRYDYFTADKGKFLYAKAQGYRIYSDLTFSKFVLRTAERIARGGSDSKEKKHYIAKLLQEPLFLQHFPLKKYGRRDALRRFLLLHFPTLFINIQTRIGERMYEEEKRKRKLFE